MKLRIVSQNESKYFIQYLLPFIVEKFTFIQKYYQEHLDILILIKRRYIFII